MYNVVFQYQVKFDVDSLNILEQSIGQDPETFMKVLLVFQIVLVAMYIIVVTFIVLLTPKNIHDENADEQTVKDSQGLLETLVS